MRDSIVVGLTLLALSLPTLAAAAAPTTKNLPHGLSPEEQKYVREHYDDYLRSKLPVSLLDEKPENVIAAPGEWERCDGAIFAWVQYTGLVRQLVKETAKSATAFVTVYGESEESSARHALEADGTNMANVRFVHADVDSVWMRDYGPWWIQTTDGDREIVDLVYNRPRPNDDKFPSVFAADQKLKAHLTKLILPGGNLILDGKGMAIMTDMVFDGGQGGNSSMTMDQLKKYMKELFGVDKIILLKAMKRDGTGHVDMFCKMLNQTTLIVGEYAKPADGAADNFKILNDNATLLSNETNGAGEPLKVFRIPMPKYTGTSYTYTNSLIVNDLVMVPVYRFASDEAALDVYRKLMPGARVVGFDCNQIIGANGAIHCITKLCMSDPMTVAHTPARGDAGAPIAISAKIESEQPVDPAKVHVYYRTGTEGEFTAIPMTQRDGKDHREGKEWSAEIPALQGGTQVQYYIRAEDGRGMHETSPEDAGPGAVHGLTVQSRKSAD